MATNTPPTPHEKIIQHFRSPPNLTFEKSLTSKLQYKFPHLHRPSSFYTVFDQRTVDAQDSSAAFQLLAPPLREIFSGLYTGTRKFEYGRTSLNYWNRHLRFAGDKLQTRRMKIPRRRLQKTVAYKVVSSRATLWNATKHINESSSVASSWFTTELIPSIKANDRYFHHFIVGDPGAGKSTLLKYLINSHWKKLREEKLILSRFEFMKFMSSTWFRGRDKITEALDDYISYLLLRDIVTAKYFSLPSGDSYQPYLNQPSRLKKQLEEQVEAAFSNSVDPVIVGTDPSPIANRLFEIISEQKFQPKRLMEIPPILRIELVRQFSQGEKLALILDGLDHLSIQDALLHTDRQLVVNEIFSNINRVTSFRTYYPEGIALDIATIPVVRENTLHLIGHTPGRLDVDIGRNKIYYVGEIDARVATFSALGRSLEAWAGAERARATRIRPISNLLMTAIDATMRIINRSVASRDKFSTVYDIFGGNLRTLFAFIRKLLTWFVEEALKESLLAIRANTKAESIFATMIGPIGLSILKRRKYRIVEILLFSEIPWFENAIRIEATDELTEMMRGGTGRSLPRIFENKYFTGVIDNGFNYHVDNHDNNADLHCLLEKTRIIQLLTEKRMSFRELNEALFDQFGYRSQGVRESIAILIRTEMIVARFAAGEGMKLEASRRGRFVTQYFCHEMSYLEHVFHRTLFPILVVNTVNDERRDLGVDNWAISSIRNCFIFATYLNFVESNRAGGRPVPENHRLFKRTSDRLIRTIKRILSQSDARSDRRPIGARVLRQIERQIAEWTNLSIIENARISPN